MKSWLILCFLILLSFWGYSQPCTLNVSLTQSSNTICSGSSIVLTAVPSGGTAPYAYVWSTGETTPSISVDKAGTYTVTVSDKTPGCAPVIKSVTVAIAPTPNAPSAGSVIVCANSSATLTATAPGGTYQWYDAATGGNFLAAGATFTTQPITVNTIFYVQTTLSGCTSARTAVYVNIRGNPSVMGATVCAGNVASLSVSTADSYTWYDAVTGGNVVSNSQTFVTPVLYKTTTYYVVVVDNGCTSGRTAVTAFVNPPPQPPVAANVTVCSGSSANLHADAPSGLFNWYTTSTGGNSLISSPDYTTPPLTATTTYYVENALNNCVSPRTPVTVTVNPIPPAPAPLAETVCYGTHAILTAPNMAAGTYLWYDAPVGGNLLATGPTFTTPALTSSSIYYLVVSNGGCGSPAVPVTVTVTPALPPPSAAGSIICPGSVTTLTAIGTGGIYRWYDAANGGNLVATGPAFATPALTATTTYYIQASTGGCTSARTPVTVTVLPVTAPPVVPGTTICSGGTAVLTAASPGNNYAWYDNASGGNLLSSGQVYVTPPLTATTTYYVETVSTGCVSTRTQVTVTVDPVPSPPAVTGATVCPGTSAILKANTGGGTAQWYDAATGGNLLYTGNTFSTPILNANTTYYVQNNTGQCISGRAAVTVSVTSSNVPQFLYSSGTFCISAPNPTPAINNPAGGTFSASPAGMVIDSKTGQINISASKPGTYVVSFAGNGACPHVTSTQIAIVTGVSTNFKYNNAPYCQDAVNPYPDYALNATAGNFTASPAGLVFVDITTGQIDLSASTPGTYTVTNTVGANGSCSGSTSTASVTIFEKINISAGTAQTIQSGSSAQLAGAISGGATTGTWSGGKGTFSNPSLLNAVYTPAPGETSAVLTLTSADPPGPCGPRSATVTITINMTPPAPTAAGATVCLASTATLSATAPGGIYQWYDSAAGGNLLATGPGFTTPPLTATTVYYVQTTIGTAVSARTAVTVTVSAQLTAPVAPGVQTCLGNPATLTASGSPGTYEWFDSPTGGNLLSTTNTYVTPALIVGASYYVQAINGNCTSSRTEVDVTVTPVPTITSASSGIICSGTALSYAITADITGATFSWSRAQVASISNPAAAGIMSGNINETLVNTGGTAVNVTYVITPLSGSCPGPAFNYVVTVNPTPTVSGPATASICNGTTPNYAITFNTAGTTFTWSRDAVPGIANAPVSGQSAATIKEVLFNTGNAPVDVTYVINSATSTCPGVPFNFVLTVNPQAVITSSPHGIACTGYPQAYTITSNVSTATFLWSRNAVADISDPAVTNQTSGTITEMLNNTTTHPVDVMYTILPVANGCTGVPFIYTATVNPTVPVPVANANSPVCEGSTIHLLTPVVAGATYLWTGPNGFTSTSQNPDITSVTAANSGTYSLVLTVRGCNSIAATVAVVVDAPPAANAGDNRLICITSTAIPLNGTITGGTSTGIWSTSGTGTFSPSANVLNAAYIPSAADKAAGSVVLTLSSTSKDDCTISMSAMTITFGPSPAVTAGADQDVCSQAGSVKLDGKITIAGGGLWSTSGTGTFSPSASQLDASYLPGAEDIKNGSVTLTLLALDAGLCYIPTDKTTIKFEPPPIVSPGGIRYVLKGYTITLTPTVNEDDVTYLWSPNVDISDVTAKNPVITGDVDRTYTLVVTDKRGCEASSQTAIVTSPQLIIDNTFTPNGDGINDLWDIKGLVAYQQATVDIFNRYGQRVFHSIGYPKSWDGTYNGQNLPVGVYYYIIDTRVNSQVLSGYVTIIR